MTGRSTLRRWPILAASWSLTAAFADITFSLFPAPTDSAALSSVARLALADALVFGVLFSAVLLVAARLRATEASRIAAAAAAASMAAAALILASPHNRMLAFFACQPTVIVCRPYAT